MLDFIKKGFMELIKTLGSKPSLLSSKRLERFLFTSTALGSVITCIVYEVIEKKLTAMETTILITPLLIAGGYNLGKTEAAKKEKIEKDGEI